MFFVSAVQNISVLSKTHLDEVGACCILHLSNNCFICLFYYSFEDQCKSWSLWLHEKEERINTEALGEHKQHIPDKKDEVQKVEAFLEELLLARYKSIFIN